jgi:hypothetical protein
MQQQVDGVEQGARWHTRLWVQLRYWQLGKGMCSWQQQTSGGQHWPVCADADGTWGQDGVRQACVQQQIFDSHKAAAAVVHQQSQSNPGGNLYLCDQPTVVGE